MLPASDSLRTTELATIFKDMSESYKLFWFNGIMDCIIEGKSHFSFQEIIDRMVVSGWYMVTEYHLNLGPSDTLEKLINYIKGISQLPSNADRKSIIDFVSKTYDAQIRTYYRTLTLYVPYRLQAPFIADFKGKSWKNQSLLLNRINTDPSLIYSINGSMVDIRENWFSYLYTNQTIIKGWIEYNIIQYLQRRNPGVPGISDKIAAPVERNLTKAKDFWRSVIETQKIQNIYASDTILSAKDISLDHFVPWSYVAHDELWNLIPTTKSINSSKGNNLPNWGDYFPLLCMIEYESYKAVWESDHVRKLFNRCRLQHVNSREADLGLYQANISQNDFYNHLEHIVRPVYQAAQNQGFSEWRRVE